MECRVRTPAGEHKTTIDPFFMVIKRYNSYRALYQSHSKALLFCFQNMKLHYRKLLRIINTLDIYSPYLFLAIDNLKVVLNHESG